MSLCLEVYAPSLTSDVEKPYLLIMPGTLLGPLRLNLFTSFGLAMFFSASSLLLMYSVCQSSLELLGTASLAFSPSINEVANSWLLCAFLNIYSL